MVAETVTTRAAWLVQGEIELGPQRRCANCRQWLPLDKMFWDYRRRAGRVGYLQPCRCCRAPAKAERERRWFAELKADPYRLARYRARKARNKRLRHARCAKKDVTTAAGHAI